MERRRHSRFIIEGVDCKVLSDSGVDIINISPQGIEIVSTVRLEMHREYTLRIDDRKKIIPLRGTVVWSVLAGQGRGPRGEQIPLYEAGLEFRNLNAAQLSDINAFISSHQISREQRAIARFEIKSPEKTTIHYPSHYPVRKISQGGILMETDRCFSLGETIPAEIHISSGNSFIVYGRVASCVKQHGSEIPRYDTGIEFLEMPEDSQATLNAFIASLEKLKRK